MITSLAAAGSALAYRGDHMDDNDWMWVFGPLMMAVWLALLAVLVWWLVTLANRKSGSAKDTADHTAHPAHTAPMTPEEVLAMRFARGEIGAAEYREALEHLRARHDNTQ
ncbi:SHOCT domain-containing protein [Yinghuangia sp. YIM S10712]|uniref:SHOCT domain-containing protein n=1 Tax=Yinghuangia sp. YIM S10712 TaxID=3436930 RepID=UPI003F535CF5